MSDRLTILQGDCLDVLQTLPDESVHCCVTSPPYWGLRDYGVAGQIGLERTPEEYVAKMVAVFAEVRRVLRSDGTCWCNLGDSYSGGGNYRGVNSEATLTSKQASNRGAKGLSQALGSAGKETGVAPKNLIGIPWRVAFALQADGWYLRSDIIWCLSGGTWLYVQTDKSGECLMTVKDLYRLKQSWVRLWNGQRWTGLLGISKSPRKGNEIELVLRSGERISCTPTHKFPTSRGLLEASEIKIGDTLTRCKLPEPYPVKDCALDQDAAWFAGLYLAEGSRSGEKIQISGHTKEDARWKRLQHIAAKFGGTCARFVDGSSTSIVLYGKVLNAIVDEFVSGRTAHDKGFAPSVWRYSNVFVEAMLRGYLSGDGHFDAANNRWRLGFCRNYNLERDLRTACARLGFHLVLNLSSVPYNGKPTPTFRGEIRDHRTGHRNQRETAEVVEIRKARCREVYDLGVANEPHLFALASGILTHNSKPNPMPESVTDRPTKAHEYIFLLSRSERYWYDAEVIKEAAIADHPAGNKTHKGTTAYLNGAAEHRTKQGLVAYAQRTSGKWSKEDPQSSGHRIVERVAEARANGADHDSPFGGTRNKRSVWTVPTAPFSEAHFATFPPDLIKPCILAGCPVGGTVLDPFGGSGTTGMVALELGRKAVLIELNPAYVEMQRQRCNVTPGLALA
jgi:DNA modification methylase